MSFKDGEKELIWGVLSKQSGDFSEAEKMLKNYYPEGKFLYSTAGFQFCDLLLSQGQIEEVQTRAKQTLDEAE